MLTRKQKEKLVADLAAEIAAGKSVTLVDFGGLSANDMVSLKKELRAIGAPLKIVKKSLLGLAMAKAEINADRNTFDGQIAVSVATQDEVGPAKVIADFAKKNENIKFVGGVLDKEVL
ncbi:MAG TPA: 50S ribosomal protein L10, partial [Candidatus Moranbacteria bacterium]|nr:50S ribosomal protein L10 [Candidatus Moranbacteria bacterium]